jgi:hypothetical protein
MTTLTPTPKQQFLDANGNPLSGGKVYAYAAGTTTPLVTYTDAGGSTPNTNPVILIGGSAVADMDAADTAKLTIEVTGVGANSADIIANNSYFSGCLVG